MSVSGRSKNTPDIDVAVEETTPWSTFHAETVARLRAAGIDSAEREATWIVERATGDPYRTVADSLASVRSHHHWRRCQTGRPGKCP